MDVDMLDRPPNGPTSASVSGPNQGRQTSAAVHRIRFVDWSPSGITSIDFAPSASSFVSSQHVGSANARYVTDGADSTARSLMAIGRENGTIELCVWTQDTVGVSPAGSGFAKGWVVHTVLVSPQQSSIDNLCFVRSPVKSAGSVFNSPYAFSSYSSTQATILRLFSTSGGSLLTEHFLPPDLAFSSSQNHPSTSATPVHVHRSKAGTTRTLSSNAGTIWSLAPSPLGRFLAIGCEGGQVRLVDVSNADAFAHLDSSSDLFARSRGAAAGVERIGAVGRMEKTKGRVMTLSWGPPRLVSGSISGPSAALTKGNQENANGKDKARDGAAGREASDESDSGSTTGTTSDSDSDSESDDDEGEEEWDESFLLGGTSSSVAVIWDISTGRLLSRLLVFKNRHESTIVWSSAILADGTIVLGDSNGGVTFYDARTRLPLPTATFKVHGDKADVLALCIGPDGKKVYSASVDQKVAEYSLVGGAGRSKGKQVRWVHTGTRRLHAHDIRALAIEPKFDMRAAAFASLSRAEPQLVSRVPILASGGTDFHVVLIPAAGTASAGVYAAAPPAAVISAAAEGGDSKEKASRRKRTSTAAAKAASSYALGDRPADSLNPISDNPLVTFAETTQRKLAYVPPTSRSSLLGGGSAAQLCAERRWIMLRRADSVAIWELPNLPQTKSQALEGDQLGLPPAAGGVYDVDQQWRKLIELQFKFRTLIICAAISPSGDLLAVSDLYETKLFRLRMRRRGSGSMSADSIEPSRLGSFGKAFAHVRKSSSSAGTGGAPGASALTFTPDGQRLVLCSYASAMVYVIDLFLTPVTAECRIAASLDAHRRKGAPTPSGRQLAGRLAKTQINGSASRLSHDIRDDDDDGDDSGNDDDGDEVSPNPSTEQVYAVIHHAKISPDGQWLLTMDSLRRAHIFSLDLFSHHKALPSPQHLPSAIIFHPTNPSYVLMLLPTNKVTIINIEKGSMGPSSAHGTGAGNDEWITRLEQTIHRKTRTIRETVVGGVWLPTTSSTSSAAAANAPLDAHPLLLWGPTWLVTVRGSSTTAAPAANGAAVAGLVNGYKRGHHAGDAEDGTGEDEEIELEDDGGDAEDDDGDAGDITAMPKQISNKGRQYHTKITFQYQSNLLVDAISASKPGDEHELVVIERPYFSLAGSLPPAYYRGVKYGS
ncbi:WD40 repeat-like protein [Tilletiaria anomala UBC 951]|uniref:WD40 repeat-like protein n=1 Tax=Tilletiaria anomala (strain ATCC 24038 / CBS 436.72 / UBC 951) TaxID=1037660 RepID=A0A066WDR3_TILAU|nr:WD40 repeat-like protein [Tilletiaria anomala UBC 951]KDN48885.1 WD40 repeat-like protein [Tilletiaria anomala UBC 951]